MNSITAPTVFQFYDHVIRTILKDGNPWFVAVDVCRALGLKNSRDATRVLDADEKGVGLIYTLGGQQRLAVINESGLYTIILRCRDAVIQGTVPHKFRKWVTSEVLPAIRKTGSYLDDETKRSIQSLCTHAEYLGSWWKRVEPGLRLLNRRLAGAIHDDFVHAVIASRQVVRGLGLKSETRCAAGYPWEAGYTERSMYVERMHRELA